MPREAGDAFLSELYSHMYAKEIVHAHHWEPGDVIIWDNVALHHARPAEATPHVKRHLRRQCIDGWYVDGELRDWSFTRRMLRAASA